jgi:ribosome recycling factor
MRNPDLAMQKLEKLNGKLTTMKVMITRPTTTTDQYQQLIKDAEEVIEDLKMMVQRQN